MSIGLGWDTMRGATFLKRLRDLSSQSHLVVFSFREEPWEAPYLDDIRQLTLSYGGQFFETRKVENETQFWESTAVDLMILVSWRYMIPPRVYRRPRLGTFVFHDSLLPEYRGFAPTCWAIVNGEDHTGVTLFEISEEMDAGPVVDQERVPIGPIETIAEVLERVTDAYLRLLERNLPRLLAGSAPRAAQDHRRATY